MAQRKRKSRALKYVTAAPWWINVSIGLVTWLIFFSVIPASLFDNPYLDPLVILSRAVAWLALVLFVLFAAISFVRSRKAARRVNPHDVQEEPPFIKIRRKAMEQVVIDQDMHTVLALAGMPEADPDWNVESLCALEWKRFELLCARYYEALGFKAETLPTGADSGIDIKLYRQNMDAPIAIVQCKSWKSQVPLSEVSTLADIMAQEKVARGIFITTGSYTKGALSFGAANPIQLLDGEALIKRILALAPDTRNALKAFAFAGDYTTPTCASCGIKLVKRGNRRSAFWGCINYPRCHMTLKIRATTLS
ncbi:MAG TPA: restriction endonuclease [Herminiimonas sp.]|nr:restriction endonuclease [Herminiimonas sp.]